MALSNLELRAQVGPPGANTQEALRQQERERDLRQRQERLPDVHLDGPLKPAESARLPTDKSPCVSIERIELKGDAAEQFQWLLKASQRTEDGDSDPATPRCLGSAGINRIMRRMMNALLDRGYVTTRLFAEQQDLNSGTLVLTLIPGRIRHIRLEEDTDPRANLDNALPAAPGEILNLRDIEQALENLKRLPTVETDIKIQPATGPEALPGESDLTLSWTQDKQWRYNLTADDSGTRSTGKLQGSATATLDHGLWLNDLFYLSLNHDLGGGAPGNRGTRGHTLHYSVPWHYWLFGLTGSRNTYHQSVAGATQTYRYSGENRNTELSAAWMALRSGTSKTTLSTKAWTRNSRNYIDGTEIEVQRRRTAGWDLGLGHQHRIGAGSLALNFNYRRGTGAMKSLSAPEEAFGEGTSRPRIASTDGRFDLPFALGGLRLRYGAAWRAQREYTPLIPQDRVSIGGRHTVRGFDGETGLSAERGAYLRNELSTPLWNSGQSFYAGLDHGVVGGRSAESLLGKELTGAVVGLRGGHGPVQYDVFAGQPVRKPENFKTAERTFGFFASASF